MKELRQQEWYPSSWRTREALQQPTYPDQELLSRVCRELELLPPLVNSWEVLTLKRQLGEAECGKRFLLQGGDCAESFENCEASIIAACLKVLLQMSLVLLYGLRKPVIRVGRFAGQYAKPRSANFETRDGVTLPVYRGDIVNQPEFAESARIPNPKLMLSAYSRSALTLNFVRSLVDGGFADLHHPEYWDLRFMEHSPLVEEYRAIVEAVGNAVSFMEVASSVPMADWEADFYTSHEALLLPYEEAQTRQVPHNPGWYNLTTHMPWIGMRTNGISGSHVEYCRGIANPIGVKVGPAMTQSTLKRLVRTLNPQNDAGRLTLITRLGTDHIEDVLPGLVEAVQSTGTRVLWCCDPMHGNTERAASGLKTRDFERILRELTLAFDIHETLGSILGGVHFELTADDVTECTGGARGLNESDLVQAYRSQVDPRLNREQALEMVFSILRKSRDAGSTAVRARSPVGGSLQSQNGNPDSPGGDRLSNSPAGPDSNRERHPVEPGFSSDATSGNL